MAAPFKLDEIRARVTPDVRAVFVQATESSTGARHDVEGIAKIVRGQGDNTLLVVDAITGLGTTHLDVDKWGVDFIIGGSQKALMMPPGLAYCAVSERAWKRMETATSPRYYFDLRKERKSAAKGETATLRRLRCLRLSVRRWNLYAAWAKAIWLRDASNWSTTRRSARR